MRNQLFIDNEWRDASGGQTIAVVNPATEDAIASVASAGQNDVDAAGEAARRALDGPWGQWSARDRARLIWKIGEKLTEKIDEIARLETLHNGKPIFESRQMEVPRKKGQRSSQAAPASISGQGYFLQPTVFDGVTPDMTIAREEIFGPVLAAIEFGDLDEAIARANDALEHYAQIKSVWVDLNH